MWRSSTNQATCSRISSCRVNEASKLQIESKLKHYNSHKIRPQNVVAALEKPGSRKVSFSRNQSCTTREVRPGKHHFKTERLKPDSHGERNIKVGYKS